jgi:hypothetical protein
MSVYNAPNQQVVREDGSGPGLVAEGLPEAKAATVAEEPDLASMTKAELLAYAQELGVSPANNDMTKDELRAGIEAHQGA